jgi:hypothetical protein
MKKRRTALSTGPMGDLAVSLKGKVYGVGDTLSANKDNALKLSIRGASTEEFGSLMDVSLYAGDLESQAETLLFHESELSNEFEINLDFAVPGEAYLRMEISSDGSRWPGIYVSSPIWIETNSKT